MHLLEESLEFRAYVETLDLHLSSEALFNPMSSNSCLSFAIWIRASERRHLGRDVRMLGALHRHGDVASDISLCLDERGCIHVSLRKLAPP